MIAVRSAEKILDSERGRKTTAILRTAIVTLMETRSEQRVGCGGTITSLSGATLNSGHAARNPASYAQAPPKDSAPSTQPWTWSCGATAERAPPRLPPLRNSSPVIASRYSPGLGTRVGGVGHWTYAADKPPRACKARTNEEPYDVREAR
jgi:hypothetical protein